MREQGVGHKITCFKVQKGEQRSHASEERGQGQKEDKIRTFDKGPTKITGQRAKAELLIRVYVQLCMHCLDKHLKQQKTGFKSTELV